MLLSADSTLEARANRWARQAAEGPRLGRERQLVTDGEAAAGALARGQLEHGLRAAPGRGTPRGDAVLDPEDGEIPVEEDGVDREAHEERVNRRGGPEQEPFALLQPVSSEKPPHAGDRGIRERAALAEDRPVGPHESRFLHQFLTSTGRDQDTACGADRRDAGAVPPRPSE